MFENFGSLKGNVSLDCRPLGVSLTAGIGMSIKDETENWGIGETQLGNRDHQVSLFLFLFWWDFIGRMSS